ncbi:hypothetical protein [Candidatus Arthromitus sp. SFB-rat-Yit]|uniref:hypothetical protein n=1 Tax=Candidatus Arthromitus sp. SFB-rat-Yit TaxID=1041504 RepID=UPI0002E96F3D|nr:hypothetical protein [Candidatus Arthromitus sp. SFB-rat-Yit]
MDEHEIQNLFNSANQINSNINNINFYLNNFNKNYSDIELNNIDSELIEIKKILEANNLNIENYTNFTQNNLIDSIDSKLNNIKNNIL